MSMNGIDYTKQLAREREYYQDSNRKMKEAADMQVENANNRADKVTTKNRENFIKDRADLEQHYQTTLDTVKDKTANAIDEKNLQHQRTLNQEKERFFHESQAQSSDFNKRLSDLRTDYSKNINAETERNKNYTEYLGDKHGKAVDEMQKIRDAKIKSFQDKTTDNTAKMKGQFTNEKENIVTSYENKLSKLHKDNTEGMADLRNKVKQELNESKNVHSSEMGNQKRHTDETISRLQKDFQSRSESMNTDYAQKNENLANKQSQSSKESVRKHQEEVAELHRSNNKSLEQMNLEKRRVGSGNSEFSDFENRQRGLKDQVVYENQIKNLKNEVTVAQQKYEERSIKEANANKETLKKEADEAVSFRDIKLGEANAEKLIVNAKEREKSQEKVAIKAEQNRLDKVSFETQMMKEKTSAEGRIKALKENYNTSMSSLERKHKERIENVTITSNVDKKAFTQEMNETRAKEVSEMKYEFNKIMDSTVQDYESRLEAYQRETAYLKESLENKIESVLDDKEKQLSTQKTLFEEQKNADKQLQKVIMDKRENELKSKFSNINNTYQRKLDKIQLASDSKLKLITNEYESKLKELQAKTSTDLAKKDTTHKVELERIKAAFEQEKSRMVTTYESQIDSIKNGHKDQMEQMKQYNRLG